MVFPCHSKRDCTAVVPAIEKCDRCGLYQLHRSQFFCDRCESSHFSPVSSCLIGHLHDFADPQRSRVVERVDPSEREAADLIKDSHVIIAPLHREDPDIQPLGKEVDRSKEVSMSVLSSLSQAVAVTRVYLNPKEVETMFLREHGGSEEFACSLDFSRTTFEDAP